MAALVSLQWQSAAQADTEIVMGVALTATPDLAMLDTGMLGTRMQVTAMVATPLRRMPAQPEHTARTAHIQTRRRRKAARKQSSR
ncbi:MAG: hypothetical protein ABJB74_14400 [Gemmatimonas sp.]